MLFHLRVHESIFCKVGDENLIKCLPFFHYFLLWWRTSCSPNIFVVIFSLFNCLHSKAIRIYLWPNILTVTVDHHASIKYLESNFMSIVLKCTVSLNNHLFYFFSISIVADQILSNTFISNSDTYVTNYKFAKESLFSNSFFDNIIIYILVNSIVRNLM